MTTQQLRSVKEQKQNGFNLVHLLTCISKLPPKFVDNDTFYVHPLDQVPDDASTPWYVGKHILSEKEKKMCNMAGISGNKINHSLRATRSNTHVWEWYTWKVYSGKNRGPSTCMKPCDHVRGQVQINTRLYPRSFQLVNNKCTTTQSRLALCFVCSLALNSLRIPILSTWSVLPELASFELRHIHTIWPLL